MSESSIFESALSHSFYAQTNEIARELSSRKAAKKLPDKRPESMTKRNEDVVSFIRSFLSENDRIPAMRDIAKHFGWASDTAADEHIKKLMRLGVLERSGACWYRFTRDVKP